MQDHEVGDHIKFKGQNTAPCLGQLEKQGAGSGTGTGTGTGTGAGAGPE